MKQGETGREKALYISLIMVSMSCSALLISKMFSMISKMPSKTSG